jgi:hypothetical protein
VLKLFEEKGLEILTKLINSIYETPLRLTTDASVVVVQNYSVVITLLQSSYLQVLYTFPDNIVLYPRPSILERVS